MRVAVFGASGFVGSAVTRRLRRKGFEVVPVVRTLGNSWELLADGCTPVVADSCDIKQVEAALRSCNAVVNCVLGDLEQLLPGLQNLLTASSRCNVKKFVHLSSITVYEGAEGELDESDEGKPRPYGYGWYKRRQDALVLQAHREGLPSIVLCPPHVIGPNSRSLLWFLRSLEQGRGALVDGGVRPCPLVDVENLAAALEAALKTDFADGKRCFVANDDNVTWVDLIESLCEIAGTKISELPNLSGDQVREKTTQGPSLRQSVIAALGDSEAKRHLKSYLRFRPRTERAALQAYRMVNAFRSKRSSLQDSRGSDSRSDLDWEFLAQQTRDFRPVCEKARKRLAYRPQVTFRCSMTSFRRWLAESRGLGTEWWDLAGELGGIS